MTPTQKKKYLNPTAIRKYCNHSTLKNTKSKDLNITQMVFLLERNTKGD